MRPVLIRNAVELFGQHYVKLFPSLMILYPKTWYVNPKACNIHPKTCNVYPKAWDINFMAIKTLFHWASDTFAHNCENFFFLPLPIKKWNIVYVLKEK